MKCSTHTRSYVKQTEYHFIPLNVIKLETDGYDHSLQFKCAQMSCGSYVTTLSSLKSQTRELFPKINTMTDTLGPWDNIVAIINSRCHLNLNKFIVIETTTSTPKSVGFNHFITTFDAKSEVTVSRYGHYFEFVSRRGRKLLKE